MGEFAEMVINGEICQQCGDFFDDGACGHPRTCAACKKAENQQSLKKNNERDPFWGQLKAHKKAKFDKDRESFLSKAQQLDDGGWVKHTEYHWSRFVAGLRLDYWPSRSKFQYEGKVQRGDVMKFIAKKESVHAE